MMQEGSYNRCCPIKHGERRWLTQITRRKLPSLFRARRTCFAHKKWAHRQQKRREIAQLLKQDEWALMDMGITRGDVREALAFKGDASLHLRALAARRRFWAKKVRSSLS